MRVEAQGSFTNELWSDIESIFYDIINGGFVSRLAGASLPAEWFSRYLSQDILYLRQDNEALELLSARAPNETEKVFFRQLHEDGIAVEQAMQGEYMPLFGVSEAKEQSPVFMEYGSFLLDSARNSPYPVALAALLPCFWLYGEVGQYVVKHQAGNNPYQKFIDTYSGEEYDIVTIHFIQLLEQYGQKEPESVKMAMREAFLKSSRFEYMVFEEAEKGAC